MRPANRVRQFRDHLRARVSPGERGAAHALMPPDARPLFDAMPIADQRHALDVTRRLRAADVRDPDLLIAALLHDVAKGPRLRLWHRVTVVLLEAVAPGQVERLGSGDPGSWRHPFYLHLHHAELSARAAEAAGAGSRVAAFIRGTASGEDAHLAAALRVADAAS